LASCAARAAASSPHSCNELGSGLERDETSISGRRRKSSMSLDCSLMAASNQGRVWRHVGFSVGGSARPVSGEFGLTQACGLAEP